MARILLIEDNSDNANLVRKVLESNGYEFLWAKNAEEGFQFAIKQHPDLILLDLGLPDMDGQTLASFLRKELSLSGVPLVAMTAWPRDVALKTVEAYRLDGYIGKPFDITAFVQQVEALLSRNQ